MTAKVRSGPLSNVFNVLVEEMKTAPEVAPATIEEPIRAISRRIA